MPLIPLSFSIDKLQVPLMFASLNLTGRIKMVVIFVCYHLLDLAFFLSVLNQKQR